MTTIVPIIMPIPAQEPDRCPNCGCEEDTIRICKSCKHEYPEYEDNHPWRTLFGLLVMFTLVALVVLIFNILNKTTGIWLVS